MTILIVPTILLISPYRKQEKKVNKLKYFQTLLVFSFFSIGELAHAHHGPPHSILETVPAYMLALAVGMVFFAAIAFAVSNKKTSKIEVKK